MRRFKTLGLALTFVALMIVGYFSFANFNFPKTQATSHENLLRGYAWSDNIGWLSLSCENENCAASNYQVKIEPFLNGKFSGYAWSDAVGWIKFDPAGPYPVTSPDHQFSARLASAKASNGKVPVKGWVRACAVLEDPVVCEGELDLNNGGWDGWIRMSGGSSDCPDYLHNGDQEARPYETCLTSDYKALDGWAWGGDVVGWIEFDPTANSIFVPSSSTKFCEVRPGSSDRVCAPN